ncbi:MAG: HAD-IB family hydrolase [Victivallaceae bacterium]|nr:HAD-IB family hydrolase [Victivallaceae bacterium]
MPKIYFFDMDHTLIDNDCDVSWKSFVVEQCLAPPDALERATFYYYQYVDGKLDITDFMDFQLQEFVGRTRAEMEELSQRHFETWVKKTIYAKAEAEVRRVQASGMPTVLLSATNRVIARPVAVHFGFDACLATELEVRDGRYTGRLAGEYALGAGKIGRARDYCESHGLTLTDAAYYGDSVNDFPMLEAVGFPIAANPCPELEAGARKNNWPIISFS